MDNGGEISGDLGVVDGSGGGFLVEADAEEELHRFIGVGSHGAETDKSNRLWGRKRRLSSRVLMMWPRETFLSFFSGFIKSLWFAQNRRWLI